MNKSEVAMNKLRAYVRSTQVYPCSEIFYQANSSKAKAEKRCTLFCETLYSLDSSIISDLRDAFHDLNVIYNMGLDSVQKPEYIKGIEDKLLNHMRATVIALDKMHKNDQLLNEYYATFRLSFQELKQLLSEVTYDFWEKNKHSFTQN